MKELPSNFSSPTGQQPRKYFSNLCKEFIKMVQKKTEIDTLEFEMEKLMNASKDLKWPKGTKDVYHKPEGEKAADKIFDEFKKYIQLIKKTPSKANDKYLLDALQEVLRLSENQKVL